MAESRIIGLVVAVVLLSFLLLLGLQSLGKVKGGIFDMLKIGEAETEKLDPSTVEKNCRQWIASGSNKYVAKKISDTYKIPEIFAPFDRATGCCLDDLNDELEKCLNPENECTVIDSEPVIACQGACNAAIQVYEHCERLCSSEELVQQCFDQIMSESRNICTREPALDEKTVCG
jgi:hypothetical protein